MSINSRGNAHWVDQILNCIPFCPQNSLNSSEHGLQGVERVSQGCWSPLTPKLPAVKLAGSFLIHTGNLCVEKPSSVAILVTNQSVPRSKALTFCVLPIHPQSSSSRSPLYLHWFKWITKDHSFHLVSLSRCCVLSVYGLPYSAFPPLPLCPLTMFRSTDMHRIWFTSEQCSKMFFYATKTEVVTFCLLKYKMALYKS